MALSIPLMVNVAQSNIQVDVRFYNDEEARLLKSYPTKQEMAHLVSDGFQVPIEEFLTYYLFHRKRPGKAGWSSYPEIGRKCGNALALLDGFLDFNGTSISTPPDVGQQDIKITENIGESIGLAVVNQIHGLTAADWDKIPEQRGRHASPTFDFQLASDGTNIIRTDGSNAIQVETKGSSVLDNTEICNATKAQYGKIKKKKIKISEIEKDKKYPHPASIRYGTICAIGQSVSDPVTCLLVDPPSDGDASSAGVLRLLLRMQFIRDWITTISPRSPFAASLQTRLLALQTLDNPFTLSEIPLIRGDGEPFDFAVTAGHSQFFAFKSKVSTGTEGGIVVPLPDGKLFFLGITQALLDQAASQNFQEIIAYRAQSFSAIRTVDCVVSSGRFQAYGLEQSLSNIYTKTGAYVTFSLTGRLFYSNSGIVFGVLPTTRS
jgi:hypothetical protein